MKRLLIFLFLALFISESCTVTKRVHRKGWHVEWRNVKHASSAPKSQSNPVVTTRYLQNTEQENFELMQSVSDESSETIMIQESETDAFLTTTSTPKENEFESIINPPANPEISNDEIDSRHSNKLTPSNTATKTDKSSRTAISPVVAGLILLILGLVSGLIGLALYFLAQNVVSTFLLVLTIIGISIFWLLALAWIIAGIVLFFMKQPQRYPPAYGNSES